MSGRTKSDSASSPSEAPSDIGDAASPGPRIKGTAVLGLVKFLRTHIDEARRILPAHLHKYLGETRILVSSWYPEEESRDLTRAVAKLLREHKISPPREDTNVYLGRHLARQDLTGHYSTFVRSRDVESAIRVVGASWKQYHDTGTMYCLLEGPGKARFELVDYGLPHPELCRVLIGWYSELFIILGCAEVSITEVQCQNQAAASCVWQARWR